MNFKTLTRAVLATLAVTLASHSQAQTSTSTTVSEDFTGTTTNLSWFYFNGACLTAGTAAAGTTIASPPGNIPSCLQVLSSYYSVNRTLTGNGDNDAYLVGGNSGYLGSSSQPGSVSAQVADPTGSGALRFTNGSPYGHFERGAIVSNYTFPTDQGVQITFKTVTYGGDSGGAGGDGADGISFYLLDGCMPITGGTVPSTCGTNTIYGTGQTFPAIGATGGSLAYTCSNSNSPYDGLVGAYLGLGIDEFGNFLNGTTNTLSESGTSATGDNTASGGGYQPGRIGLRGAGSISWQALNTAYPSCSSTTSAVPCYPSSLSSSQRLTAVQNTCKNGTLYNYSNFGSPVSAGATALSNTANSAGILDYAAISGAYSVLSGVSIANESATTRSAANTIYYSLKITTNGLLSLSYSYNGGTAVPVITNQQILNINGALPGAFRFGFAGSTGGDTNVHEILCFKAAPVQSAGTSGAVTVQQNPTLKTGSQIFLANYFPSDWTGQLEAVPLQYNATTQVLTFGTPTWDARCVLTGVTTATGACSTGVTSQAAEAPSSRVMTTWGGTAGIPFEWASLTTAQQNTLDAGDTTPYNANRLNFIRGDRTNEVTASGSGLFRARDAVLSDIVDSSPNWVGAPQTYPTTAYTWVDAIYPTATQPENATTAQTYAQFVSAQYTGTPLQSRMNVVYAGANDGFLHGFRAGTMDTFGNLNSTNNDGQEVFAYMPSVVFNNIHPVTSTGAVNTGLDFANLQYAHNWFVDAPPAEGDLFYGGAWHTWVVGGLGPGGADIYAIDVTDPTKFTNEASAAALVMGDWSTSNLTCHGDTSSSHCYSNLGNTYGTPEIRRFHNGQWGFIFGNGFGSTNGTAGIFIGLVSAGSSSTSLPTVTFYYLPTGSTATGNGIADAASADLDLDHTVDYIYAGDLLGNVWKFNVTSNSPSNWAVTASSPLFTAGTTAAPQPITTKIMVSSMKLVTSTPNAAGLTLSNGPERVVLNFGTGRQIPQTVTQSAQYQANSQYLYGIWDWDMGTTTTAGSWNALSPHQPAYYLTGSNSITTSVLASQTLTEYLQTSSTSTTPGYATLTSNPVCWNGTSTCASATNNQMGWYTLLAGTSEQIIYDPFISPVDGTLNVNTYIPSPSNTLSCTSSGPWGFSLVMDASTGAGLNLFSISGVTVSSGATGSSSGATGTLMAAGFQTNAAGTSTDIIANGMVFQVFHNGAGGGGGGGGGVKKYDYTVTSGSRMYWTQKR